MAWSFVAGQCPALPLLPRSSLPRHVICPRQRRQDYVDGVTSRRSVAANSKRRLVRRGDDAADGDDGDAEVAVRSVDALVSGIMVRARKECACNTCVW